MGSLGLRSSGAVCVGIWTVLALFRGRFWRLRERLGRGGDAVASSVVAVIPARDERLTIGTTVSSLLRQAAGLRIIVADDESTDGTGAAAREAGAEVVRVGARPAGWKGKLWAVSEGVRAAGSGCDYFLLTDADIECLSPDVLPGLLAKAAEGFDLASVMVRLRCQSPAEKMLIPAFVFFFFMLYPPAWVASGRGSAAAAGDAC
jgi:glycosyltransferase involved in cell wall biosynthesis